MPGLLLKDLPKKVHARLKARAAAHHRSMAAEALVVIEAALSDHAGPPSLAEMDALRVKGNAPLTQALLDEARSAGRP